jgi:uncharacterized damage-inducible protein DinB
VSIVERVDPPYAADERTMLEAWLDYHRATVHVKCDGLADSAAWLTPLPSSPLMSPAGLVSHLYWVERGWFERLFAGAEYPVPWTAEDPDADFRQSADEALADVLARYADQCERSREITRGLDLDTTRRNRVGAEVSLRWVYLHMIEETARHNGHLDAMRELADGVIGD